MYVHVCIGVFLGSYRIVHTELLMILAKSKNIHRQSMRSKHGEQITDLGKLCKGGQTLKMT